MRILSLLILAVLMFFTAKQTDSPHGSGFKISCKTCHSPKGWQLDKEIYSFNHNKTRLPLTGQHTETDCKQCHPTLVFSEAKTRCNDCHTDIHQATVGLDCERCHTPVSWLVNNLTEMHIRSRFPLLGPHRSADCSQCHLSDNLTRFDVIGINCVDCHRKEYMATANPNHIQTGLSEDCQLCHKATSFQWTGAGFDHQVFPLVQGHSSLKCSDCHEAANHTNTNPDCYSCHQQDYLTTNNPDHSVSKISTACQECHTLAPGWKPSKFNHTSFPLTQGHSAAACIDCHTGGNYTSTPKDCNSCHHQDFIATTNPNHTASGFSTECQFCHTTNVGWTPTTVNHSSFPLTLGHSSVACNDCHTGGNYTALPKDCYSCHKTNYNNTTNPNHASLSFSTSCITCHTTVPGWKPASYTQHDSQFFPIYSGRHSGRWISCTDCHLNPANYALFNCKSCHSNVHSGRSYTDQQCYQCHPRGIAD